MSTTRRDFFRVAAALPASWTAFSTALTAASGAESYWQLVKREFPLEDKLVYLNAANVCPASRPVMDRHLEYLRDFHANPSFQNRDKYVAMRESLRGSGGTKAVCHHAVTVTLAGRSIRSPISLRSAS